MCLNRTDLVHCKFIALSYLNHYDMNGSLFLAPENPDSSFSDIETLKKSLVENGLIQPSDSNTCYCGDSFAQLVTFMGCSPHLVFEPPEDGNENYCHIILHHHEQVKLYTGQQTAPPRCPSCRFRLADWKNDREKWSERPEQSWECPQCQASHVPATLDWRQSGGAGRLLIEIKNIFPGEAVPVDLLMNSLKNITSEKWRYFYLV